MKFKPRSLNAVVANLKKLPYVEAIILFGSHARGTARQDSDIDIAVITKGATEEQEWDIIEKTNELDINTFSRLPLPIQFRIIKEGKTLFIRNKKVFEEVQLKTIRNYFDFQPFLDRMYRSVIENV